MFTNLPLFCDDHQGHGVIGMEMWCWMWWKRNSRITWERWRVCEMLPERSVATQPDGQPLKMMRIVTQISLRIRIIHSRWSKQSSPPPRKITPISATSIAVTPSALKTIPSFMTTVMVEVKSQGLNWVLTRTRTRTPSGVQSKDLPWWVKYNRAVLVCWHREAALGSMLLSLLIFLSSHEQWRTLFFDLCRIPPITFVDGPFYSRLFPSECAVRLRGVFGRETTIVGMYVLFFFLNKIE